MNNTAILFDLDGTLLDTLEDLTDSVNHVLAEYGCPERTMEQVRTFVGNGAGQLIRLALPGEANDPEAGEVLAAFQRYYKEHCRIKTRPYEGILRALKELGRQYPLAIVSNKPDLAVKPLCGDYFPGIYAQGETIDCPRKPAPDMVIKAARVLGVKPEHCIYVGDSEVDVQTARNAGMACISVLWGFRDEKTLKESGARYLCREPGELAEIVKELEIVIHGQ